MPNLADIKTCTGCLLCIDACPKDALSVVYNEEGHLIYEVDCIKCVECGMCEKKCPVTSCYNYGCNVVELSTPYAAWAVNGDLRKNSSSGGVFSSLAYYVISKGGVAIGASLEKNIVKHVIVDTIDDIVKLQGSKYTQSDASGIYRRTKQLLSDGKIVLFSGTGCQVAGLLSFLEGKNYDGQLITTDLICGGVPSRYIIDSYLKANPNVKEIAGFRNKAKYEFSIIDTYGNRRVVPLNERPFPLCGFYTELTNRYACYDCKFNGAHRKSDITIGDYWGDDEYPEQHRDGLSIAVAHTEKGREMLCKANLEIHETRWETFLMHNPRMIDGYKRTSQSRARKNLAKAFREYPYERLLQIYANKATLSEPLLMINKIYRYLIGRVNRKKYNAQLNKMIKQLIEQ